MPSLQLPRADVKALALACLLLTISTVRDQNSAALHDAVTGNTGILDSCQCSCDSLAELTFSSMTCFRVDSATTSASLRVTSFLYSSCKR